MTKHKQKKKKQRADRLRRREAWLASGGILKNRDPKKWQERQDKREALARRINEYQLECAEVAHLLPENAEFKIVDKKHIADETPIDRTLHLDKFCVPIDPSNIFKAGDFRLSPNMR